MTNQHPITPPPELWKQFAAGAYTWKEAVTYAYRAGADDELEACCEWLEGYAQCGYSLRAARRPKSLSPKDQVRQALAALSRLNSGSLCANPVADKEIIRRALEQLDD